VIVKIGSLRNMPAKEAIDAAGLVVALVLSMSTPMPMGLRGRPWQRISSASG
jgi:hypothetical protein